MSTMFNNAVEFFKSESDEITFDFDHRIFDGYHHITVLDDGIRDYYKFDDGIADNLSGYMYGTWLMNSNLYDDVQEFFLDAFFSMLEEMIRESGDLNAVVEFSEV